MNSVRSADHCSLFSRNLGRGIALSAVTGLVAIFALEVGTRMFLGNVFYPRPPLYVFDETLLYKLRPSMGEVYAAPDFQVSITTDSHGHRICSDTAAIPSDGVIVTMGDSYTMGWGVNDDETWPCFLEQYVKRDSEFVISVVNTGVNGYGTWQYRRITESMVLGNDAKILAIVIMLVANDPADNVRFQTLTSRPEEEVVEMMYTTVLGAEDMQPFSIGKRWIQNKSYAYWMLSRKGFFDSVKKAVTLRIQGVDKTLDVKDPCVLQDCSYPIDGLVTDMAHIVSIADSKSIPVFVVSANPGFLGNGLDSVCPEDVPATSRFTGCVFINLYEYTWPEVMFNQHSGGHFSARGNRVIGEQIGRYVLDSLGG